MTAVASGDLSKKMTVDAEGTLYPPSCGFATINQTNKQSINQSNKQTNNQSIIGF